MPSSLLIVNPKASAVTPARTEAVANTLGAHVVETEGPGHATELVREMADGVVYVFSGDGGFNEALNGSVGKVPLGFIPGGGSSVLPRALGLPRDPEAAARQLAGGRQRRISVGRVNGRRFGFAAAIGFPAEVVRRVDELGRANARRPPDRTFATTIARGLFERRGRIDPELRVDGEPVAFVLVANGDPYTYFTRLPLRFAPDASFEGGLDLVAPRSIRPGAIPRVFAAAALGRRAGGVLYRHDLDRFEIGSDRPLPLQVDGEDLGDVGHAVFESERRALTVLV